MIDEDTKKALREVFERLPNPVKIKFYSGGEYAEETEELLRDICQESEKVSYEKIESSEGPKITFEGYENIQFLGIPTGYQMISLIEMVIGISRRLDLGIDFIKEIDKEVELLLFVIPNCRACPTMVRNLLYISLMNPKVTLKVIEAYEFQDLLERYNVTAVPRTIIKVEGKEEDSFEGLLDLENTLMRIASVVSS